MPAMKRPAAASAGAAAKKPTVAKAPAEAKKVLSGPLGKVASGICLAEAPQSAKDMLRDMLETALGVVQEERGKYQTQVVEMIGAVLSEVESGLQKSVEDAEAAIAETAKTKEAVDDQIVAKKQELEAKHTEVEGKKRELAKVALAFKAAREEVTKAKEACHLGDAEALLAEGDKDTLSDMLTSLFRPLAEGSIEEPSMSDKIKLLVSKLGQYNFDASMIVSLPSVLAKAPTARTSFDTMVLTSLGDELAKRVDAKVTTIREAEPAKAARAEVLSRAEAALEEATSKQVDAAAAYTKVRGEEEEHESSLADLQQTRRQAQQAAVKSGKDRSKAETALSKFRDGPLHAFEQLRDAKAEPAVAEEVAPGDSTM